MSIHISGQRGVVAPTVLLPGDPLRAKFVAEKFLEGAQCYTQVRNMLGYTGTYKGQPISAQGTGMGIPSLLIYATELIDAFGATTLVRIGTCGSLQGGIKVGDIIVGATAVSDSAVCPQRSHADGKLLERSVSVLLERKLKLHVGEVYSSDVFYDTTEQWRSFAAQGAVGVEMESAGLFQLATQKGVRALSVLLVSDNLVTKELIPDRYKYDIFESMVQGVLDSVGGV